MQKKVPLNCFSVMRLRDCPADNPRVSKQYKLLKGCLAVTREIERGIDLDIKGIRKTKATKPSSISQNNK